MAEEDRIITIDGKQYRMSDLAGEPERQLNNIRGVELEIQQLQRQLAIAQTARSAYAQALQTAMKEIEHVGDAPAAAAAAAPAAS